MSDKAKETQKAGPVYMLGAFSVVAVVIGFAIHNYGARSDNLLSDAPASQGLATFGTVFAVAGGICLLAAIIIGVVRASGHAHE